MLGTYIGSEQLPVSDINPFEEAPIQDDKPDEVIEEVETTAESDEANWYDPILDLD